MTILDKHEVEWIKTPWGEEGYCKYCGSSVHWEDCDQCEDGYSYHDCGEDTCCCLDPEPNVECDVCYGEGGWYVCLGNCGKKKPNDLEIAAENPNQTKLVQNEREKEGKEC